MPEGKAAGRYGRPTRQAAVQRTRAAPRLTVSKVELTQIVANSVGRATAEALERERKKELRRSKRRAKTDSGRFEKSGSEDLARRMAAQAAATRQRQVIGALVERYEAATDPYMKSSLGQEITLERLKLAHRTGRI